MNPHPKPAATLQAAATDNANVRGARHDASVTRVVRPGESPPREWRPGDAVTALGRMAIVLLGVVGLACGSSDSATTDMADADAAAGPEAVQVDPDARGTVIHTAEASPGYVLYGPLLSDTTYLIDNDGAVVHSWTTALAPSGGIYLKDDGNLLRGGRVPDAPVFSGGGQGGRMQEFTWDGELVWDWEYATDEYLLHHDVEILPNGNILAIAWEAKTAEEARAAGRREDLTPESGLWPDKVIEIEPLPPNDARIVWEWHMWDHLVQDADPELPNHGDPAERPWRIDINGDREPQVISDEELEQLKALGYVPPDTDQEDIGADLLHTNAVAYNAELDQIALSTPRFNEIWIIDHSTTTEEAAGSTGGRWGRGGDLLYRWGNPQTYGRGDEESQQLYAQHDVRWIPEGYPGAGHLTIFNNAVPGPDDDNHSTVIEIAPTTNADGSYALPESGPFGPTEPAWSYSSPADFHAPFISGATRLPNGNTLICSGPQGRFFEVTPEGRIVWEYRDPYSGDVRMPDGSTPHPVGEFTYAVFRATRIPPDHPALAGRTLTPLDPQPPIPEAPAAEGDDEAAAPEERQ